MVPSTEGAVVVGVKNDGNAAERGITVGDVIVGGVAPPPGETLWDQSRFIARDESLRNFASTPRG